MNLNPESQRENLNKYGHYNVVFLFCKFLLREGEFMKKILKKGFKIMAALLMIISSFPQITEVKAATVNDTLYVDTSYTFDVATTKYADPNAWVIGHENPIRRRSDNQPVYCIQAHIHFDDNSNVIGYDDDGSHASLSGLSFEDRQRIFNIAYYGYGYGNHTSMDWYAATQILIWSVSDRNNNPPYPIAQGDTSLTRSNRFDAMFNEINYLVDHDHLTVSFNGQSVETEVGKTITFKDDNEVLSNFFTVHSDDVDATIDGNNLIIKSNKKYEGSIDLTPKSNVKPLIYDGANQKVISRGDPRKVKGTVKIKFNGGDVELFKKDKDTKLSTAQGEATLEGAVYEIFDADSNELITTVTTGKDGKIKSEQLPYIGKFYLKEKTPSKGYQLDVTKYYFEITKDNLHPSINAYEKVINLNFDITKVFANDSKTEIMMPEPNVTFGFYDNKGNLYKKMITDKNGNIYINLPYGTYTVKQLTTSKGHEKVEDFVLKVEEVGEDVRLVISNAEIKARLKVVKIDKETKEVIKRKGIKFKIFDIDKNDYVCQTVTYPNKENICIFETDENGEFLTPYVLNSGRYKLEEVNQKIDGYVWNKESHEFEIGENTELITDSEYGILFDTKFENQRVKGQIKINKVGEKAELKEEGYVYTNEILEGVKFCVYARDDIKVNGKVVYKKGTKIKCGSTDKDGVLIFNNLELGNYFVKEISTLDGYILDESEHDINLKYKDQYTPVINYETLIENRIPTGKLEFTKTDFSESKTLPNTIIEIYTENDELVFRGKTDENGKIVIDKLPAGQKYYIIEKEAPEGYQLNPDKMWFEITKDGEVIKATMKDEQIIDVPDTEKNKNNTVLYCGIGLLILGTGVIIYAKKKRKK